MCFLIIFTFHVFTECGADELVCIETLNQNLKCIHASKILDGNNDCGQCSDENFSEECFYGMLIFLLRYPCSTMIIFFFFFVFFWILFFLFFSFVFLFLFFLFLVLLILVLLIPLLLLLDE